MRKQYVSIIGFALVFLTLGILSKLMLASDPLNQLAYATYAISWSCVWICILAFWLSYYW